MNSLQNGTAAFARKFASLLLLLSVTFTYYSSASAQIFTWGPSQISSDWHSAVNWSGGTMSNPIPDDVSDIATVSFFNGMPNPALFTDLTIGSLTIENGATLTTNTFDLNVFAGSGTTGNTQIDSGALLFAPAGSNIQTYSLNGAGQIQLNSSSLLTVGQDGTSNGSGLFSGAIIGAGAFSKTGFGIMTLDASNTFSGETTVLEGRLRLSGGGRLSNESAVTVENGAIFELNIESADAIWGLNGTGSVIVHEGSHLVVGNFNGFPGHLGGTGSFSGTISGNGAFSKRGIGTQTLEGNNAYKGDTTVSEGTLRLSEGGRLDNESVVTVGTDAIFELDIMSADAIWGLNGTGSVVVNDGSHLVVGNFNGFPGHEGGIGSFSGTISGGGAFSKRGIGTQTLSFINTYKGDTTVSEGTLQLSGGGRLDNESAVTVETGATFELDIPADAIWGLNGTGSVVLNNGSNLIVGNFGNQGGIGTFSGNIQGDGELSKRGLGTQHLESGNMYSGLTTVSEGVLRVANASGSATGSGDILVDTDGTLEIDEGSISTGSLTIDGMVDMTGGFLNTDELDFENGSFSMSDGRLAADMVVGNLTVGGGTLAIGDSPGLMTIDGSYSQSAGTTLEIEIGGVNAGSEYDQMMVAGDVLLAGSLDLQLIDSFVPPSGTEFTIIAATGNLNGEFEGLADGDLVGIFGGVSLFINYDSDSVSLFAIGGGVILGDVNLDGVVNLLDVQPFVELISTGTFQIEADINEDGIVNLLDVDPFVQLLSGN